jgi:hypothetical protein
MATSGAAWLSSASSELIATSVGGLPPNLRDEFTSPENVTNYFKNLLWDAFRLKLYPAINYNLLFKSITVFIWLFKIE